MKKAKKDGKATGKVWIIALFNDEGRIFQRVNAKGAYDDSASFATRAEAEAYVPAISAEWAKCRLAAKAMEIKDGFVGTPRD
jgi:hypothetical protein